MISNQPLAPLISLDIAEILDLPGMMAGWVASSGSPLHVLLPQAASRNARQWAAAAGEIFAPCDIRFALKSCKSHSVVKAFGLAGIGADVSSVEELQRAITGYVPSSRISFTGPDKSDHDHLVCLRLGVNVHVDNPREFDRFLALADQTRTAPIVTLRLQPQVDAGSRFGMSGGEVRECALRLGARKVALEGIAFHVGGYGVADRIDAATECLSLIKGLAGEGIACRSLDIGGGFPMRYLNSDFAAEVDGLPRWGQSSRKGDYPYNSPQAGPEAMQAVIGGILARDGNRRFVAEQKMTIVLQPGRALLDQCGLSAFKILGRKQPPQGLPLLILDGMSFSLSETWFGADFLPAPVMITTAGRFNCSGAQFALAGRSCLEADFIRRIAVDFAATPEVGNLIVFLNTAGYQMDSNESEFHQRPLPNKIAVMRGSDGWQHYRDDVFSVEEFRHDHHTYQ